MPYDTIEDTPEAWRTHQGATLSLEQINRLAAIYDSIKSENPDLDDSTVASIAWTTWEKEYTKDGEVWTKRETENASAMSLSQRVLQASSIQALFDKYPPTDESKAWATFSKWGDDDPGWRFDDLIFAEELTEELLGKLLWNGEWMIYEVDPEISDSLRGAVIIDMPDGGQHFKIKMTSNAEITQLSEALGKQPIFGAALKLAEVDGEEGKTEVLLIDTTLLAEGTWKGNFFPADKLKESVPRATNVRIDIEHEDETWEDVKGFSLKPVWNEELKGVDIQGIIFDPKVIEWYKEHPDEKLGVSARLTDDTKFEVIDGKSTATYIDYKGYALTLNPACKLAWVKSASVVQLSSTSNTGGNSMTETPKPTGEALEAAKLAEEKKAQEAKAAEEAKLAAEKKEKEEAEKLAAKKKEEEELADKSKTDMEKKLAAMDEKIAKLEAANKSLSSEKNTEKAETLVNTLIDAGSLSEANRESATELLLSMDGKQQALYMSSVSGKAWNSTEQGLVLSEDKDKKEELELSEPVRGHIR